MFNGEDEHESEPDLWPEPDHDVWAKAMGAYDHAKRVLNGPYPEGEEDIAKDGLASAHYAIEVLRDRFLLGEKAIFRSRLATSIYLHHFSKELALCQKLTPSPSE